MQQWPAQVGTENWIHELKMRKNSFDLNFLRIAKKQELWMAYSARYWKLLKVPSGMIAGYSGLSVDRSSSVRTTDDKLKFRELLDRRNLINKHRWVSNTDSKSSEKHHDMTTNDSATLLLFKL